MEQVGAVIVAAGAGLRMGQPGGVRKQYLSLAGKPVLLWSLAAFEQVEAVTDIVLVVPAEDVDWVARDWAAPRPGRQRIQVVAGGPSRQASVSRGREALPEGCRWVVVHDAARPFVSPALIHRVLAAARATGAAVPGIPVSDTIKRVDGGGRVVETLHRPSLRAIQTPQAFRRDVLSQAHADGSQLAAATDDAALVERLGFPVAVVEGEPDNIKLTHPGDLQRAEAILKSREGFPPPPLPFRIGYGFDVHRLAEGRALILGGVEIPWEKGLLGHSDADVLAHAVTDALLGAAGLGDIGRHFPDTDEAYKGADSLRLLERAVQMAEAAGWRISQVDATVVAQRPKLAPYVPCMRERLAAALRVAAADVNVKATTSEGLGFTGRGEGMAAHAVVLLSRAGQ